MIKKQKTTGKKEPKSAKELPFSSKKDEKPSPLFSILWIKYVILDSKLFTDRNFKSYPGFKILVNVIFLIELLLSGMRMVHGLRSEEIKQSSETHRVLVKYLSSPTMRYFFAVIAVFYTVPYSGEFKIERLIKLIIKYTEGDLKGARMSGITLKKGMSEVAIDKVTKGAILSMKGSVSTHPIYYANKVEAYYDIDLETMDMSTIKIKAPFPNCIDQAIDTIVILFQDKDLIDPISKTSIIEKGLGLKRVAQDESGRVDPISEGVSDDPEELELIKRINNIE